MSGTKTLKEQQRTKNTSKPKEGVRSSKGSIVAFNPTDEEKLTIRGDGRPLDVVLGELEASLQNGHVLTLKYNDKNDCYMVLLREGAADWQQAVCLSCWHKSSDTAFRMLSYALAHRWPDFPDNVIAREFSDNDW